MQTNQILKDTIVVNSITKKTIEEMTWDEIKANLGPKMTRDEVFSLLKMAKKGNS